MTSIEDALKASNYAVKYSRVSTGGQVDRLPAQAATITKNLKARGYKGKSATFDEVGSGTKHTRPTLQEAILDALEAKKKGKKVVFVVRDMQRFSRSSDDFGYLKKFFPSFEESLWSNDIPIIALNDNIITGVKSLPNPNDDLIGPILVSVGESEVNIRKEQSLQGKARAAEEGIVAGTPQNLYYKDDPNPIRLFYDLALLQGVTTAKAAAAAGRSRSWGKDLKKKLQGIILEGNRIGKTNLIDEWLNVTDLIRDFEKANGPRIGGGKKMNSVSRKTSGYLKFPWKYPAPTQEDLQFYFENFRLFQPKKKN